MKSNLLRWSLPALMATTVVAQKPPAQPDKPDDAAVLEDAIRAVDRAAEKSTPARESEKPKADAKAAPNSAAPSPKPPAGDRAAGGTERPAVKPASVKREAPPPTNITSLEGWEMDNPGNTITFLKNVVVERPDLKIWCDRLEFVLNKAGAKKAPSPADGTKPASEPDQFSSERIKTATATAAEGGMVVIWRKTATGDVVAIGRRAVYTATTGTFTITGLPEVLRDDTYHVQSPNETDTLVLLKNGSARGKGGKQELNLSSVRAKEIRQRLFSHVPGKRPPEASGRGGVESSASVPAPPAPALPAPPKPSTSGN